MLGKRFMQACLPVHRQNPGRLAAFQRENLLQRGRYADRIAVARVNGSFQANAVSHGMSALGREADDADMDRGRYRGCDGGAVNIPSADWGSHAR